MKYLLPLSFFLLFSVALSADPSGEDSLDDALKEWRWNYRVVLVGLPSEANVRRERLHAQLINKHEPLSKYDFLAAFVTPRQAEVIHPLREANTYPVTPATFERLFGESKEWQTILIDRDGKVIARQVKELDLVALAEAMVNTPTFQAEQRRRGR